MSEKRDREVSRALIPHVRRQTDGQDGKCLQWIHSCAFPGR